MFALMGSLGPVLVLLALVAVCCFVAFRWRSARSRARKPEDITAAMADKFVIKPYVQLGNYPRQGSSEQFAVLWHVKPDAVDSVWALQARVAGEEHWRSPVPAHSQLLEIDGLGKTVRCGGTLAGLPFGVEVEYRVLRDGNIAFTSSCKTRNHRRQPYTFVVAGDLGVPLLGKEQRIAYQISLKNPDFMVVPGDIVYERGRVSEYMTNFFPVYNSDVASPEWGAPLLRSMLMIGAPGNHDMGMPKAHTVRDFSQFPDLLGYYVFFSQPLNGAQGTSGGGNYPDLRGDPEAQKRFQKAAGIRFPRMACFSFEWGNSFWLVLDANAYMDWTDAALRQWVSDQLAGARNSTWKFVTFHHPAFSSDGKHVNEQRMRLLAPVFQEHGVDVVFVGHVHCYERTHPLRFEPYKLETRLHTEECPVDGSYVIDREYDGVTKTRPDGVIYVTSGAGGAKFHKESDPGSKPLQPYTRVYNQTVHSFTYCEMDGNRVVMRQISEDGIEIDSFTIDK